jgi:hypothetical protein
MKQLLSLFTSAGLALVVAACGASAPATVAPPASAPPQESPTAVAVAATPTSAGAMTSTSTPAPTVPATEQATPAYPTPNPDPQCVALSIPADPKVPSVTDADWTKGPADAPVTVIEYGDFQ